MRVAISGRTRATLEMVAETLASRAGGRPAIVVGDVGAKSGPAQIAAEAAAALGGRIDILVNNAGAARPITDEVDDAYWDESFTLNFMAARRLTDLVIPAMKAQRWGRIISISGALVAPRLNAAAPAKAALASWSRTLASELGAYGITVNTIAPGRINTAQILKVASDRAIAGRLHQAEHSCRLFRRALRHRPSRCVPGLPARALHQRRCDPGRRRRGAAGALNSARAGRARR